MEALHSPESFNQDSGNHNDSEATQDPPVFEVIDNPYPEATDEEIAEYLEKFSIPNAVIVQKLEFITPDERRVFYRKIHHASEE